MKFYKIFCLNLLCGFFLLQASDVDNGKRKLEEDSSQESKRAKIRPEPQKFHFNEWNDGLLPVVSLPTVKKEPMHCLVDCSKGNTCDVQVDNVAMQAQKPQSELSHYNLQQMRTKMSSVTHSLKGEVLKIRVYEIDESLLGIESQDVKKLITDIFKHRIETSCALHNDCKKITSKKIRSIVNTDQLKYVTLLQIIKLENHKDAINEYIATELETIQIDCQKRYCDASETFAYETLPCRSYNYSLDNKLLKIGIIMKNNDENFKTIIDHYMTAETPSSPSSPTLKKQSRDLFSALEALEQAIICDNFVTKKSLESQYLDVERLYRSIEPKLSEQAKIYAQSSLLSLPVLISNFQEY